MIKGIAHTAYDVADMEKSMEFYCGILGLKKAFEIHDDDGKPWIEYIKVCDGQFIELFYNRDGMENGGSYSHLCLEVEDINEIVKHLKDNGVTIDSGPSRGKDGNYQCWAKDPDGNRIEFMQMMPDSLQKNS